MPARSPRRSSGRQRRLGPVEDVALSSSARGMMHGDISVHLSDVYGSQVSRTTIPTITDTVLSRKVYVVTWATRGDQPDKVTSAAGGGHPGGQSGRCWGSHRRYSSYLQWSKSAVYEQGSRVLFGGVACDAKWWTQCDSPDRSEVDESSP